MTRFQFDQITVVQDGGTSYSLYAGWHPRLRILESYALGLELGASPVKARDTGRIFLLGQMSLSVWIPVVSAFYVRPTLGLQFWGNRNSTYGLFGLHGGYRLRSPLLSLVDAIEFGYQNVSLSPSAHQFLLGVQLGL